MIKPLYLICLSILLISGYGLFHVKHRVQNLKRDLYETQRQLKENREAIHVLKAEWAYLNQPSRLKKLASKHLDLKHIEAKQLYLVKDFSVVFSNHHASSHRFNVIPIPKPILSSVVGVGND